MYGIDEASLTDFAVAIVCLTWLPCDGPAATERRGTKGMLMSFLKMCACATIMLAVTAPVQAQFTTVDLRPYFDNDGISSKANLADGDFNFQCSYPAEEIPPPGRCVLGGVLFEFPDYADGVNNCVKLRGKMIDLPDVSAITIYLLGSALFSNYGSAAATLYYVDGSSERHLITFDSWSPQGCVKVLETKVFHVQNRIADSGGWPLYVTAIYPQRDAPIDALVLADTFTGAQSFALTLSSVAPQGELAKELPPFGIASIDWGLAQAGAHRVVATINTVRSQVSKLEIEWACGEQKEAATIEVVPGSSSELAFDCQLAAGSNSISLTITDEVGRKRVVTRNLAVKAMLVVRTERPVVLDDAEPIEVEVLVNIDVAARSGHGLVLELVTFQNEKEGT